MYTCVIKNCEYAKFEAVRDVLFDTIPFAIIYIGYSPKKKIGVISFSDLKYCPPFLEQFLIPSYCDEATMSKVLESLSNEISQLLGGSK